MIAYGYSVKGDDDSLLDLAETAVYGFSECMEPGAYLVDMIPFRKSPFLLGTPVEILKTLFPRAVRYVPDWFPGAGWKVKAKRYAKSLDDTTEIPYQFVKDQMVSRWSC